MNLNKNDCLEVEIIDMNSFGLGVAKAHGFVIFVQNGVTEDLARIRIIKKAKNYCIARIEELLSPSPYRIEPSCEHFRHCGGCSFQHITYEYELLLKQKFVQIEMKKAGLSEVEVLPTLPSPSTEHYRNKTQFPLSASSDEKILCGFYARNSHKVYPVSNCRIQEKSFSEIADCTVRFLEEKKISVYDEKPGKGLVRHIYLRFAKSTGQICLCLVLTKDAFPYENDFIDLIRERFPNVVSIALNIQPKQNNVILGEKNRILWGREKIEDELCGVKLFLSPPSFYQVNHDAAELLYHTAFELAGLKKSDTVFDLYCGIGSISLCASKRVGKIFGVEIIPQAVEDAKFNAKINGIKKAEFFCGDAKDAFRILSDQGEKIDVVIVDPPRKGLSPDLIDELCSRAIEKILYISCSPDTFARDLARFRSHGYRFDSVQPVDLFPRTGHVENIAVLCLEESKKS